MGYLKYGIIIDVQEQAMGQTEDIKANWEEQYPNSAIEEVSSDMPKPVNADADHVHNWMKRRSVTRILLFVNNTPIKWYSKRQNTVETSTCGAEWG